MSPTASQASDAEPADGAAAAAARRRDLTDRLYSILARYGLLVAFVVMILVFSLAKPDAFPTWDNAKSILTAAAPALIIAVGLTVVLVMQDFDLSFGAMIGLAGGAAVVFMVRRTAGPGRSRCSPRSASASAAGSPTAS